MEIATSFVGKALEKLPRQSESEARRHILVLFGFRDLEAQTAHAPPDEVRSPTEINNATGQTFIHGDIGLCGEGILWIKSVAIASNAFFIAERLHKCLSESDPAVFHRVVSVHLNIATTLQFKVDHRMFREQAQHVIKEGNSRLDIVFAFSINIEAQVNLRFTGMPPDSGPSLLHFRALNTVPSKRKREKYAGV